MSGRGEGKSKATTKRTSKSKRAGLQFPVARLARHLKKGQYAKRVGASAPVSLAAVMEYLAAEVLEVAVEACSTQKKKVITPRHIQLGIRGDDELVEVFCRVSIAEGGVIPDINPLLLPTKTHANLEKEATSCKAKKTKLKSRGPSSGQQK